MQLHELFSATGEVWFKRDNHYYSLIQVQTIMRDTMRTQPKNAAKIFQRFQICKNPPIYAEDRKDAR
jgi:hypothetical protein